MEYLMSFLITMSQNELNRLKPSRRSESAV